MSTPKPEILAPEYGALFPIHKPLRVADSDVKDNKNVHQIYNFISQNWKT
jgi:hypothetical protein